MKKFALLVSFALASLGVVSLAPAQIGKKSDAVVKISTKLEKSAAGKASVLVTLDIQKGWHLYANPVGNEEYESNQVKVTASAPLKVEYPAGKAYIDESGGKLNIYQGKVQIRAAIDSPTPGATELSVQLQACSDGKGSVCLLPATIKIPVK